MKLTPLVEFALWVGITIFHKLYHSALAQVRCNNSIYKLTLFTEHYVLHAMGSPCVSSKRGVLIMHIVLHLRIQMPFCHTPVRNYVCVAVPP